MFVASHIGQGKKGPLGPFGHAIPWDEGCLAFVNGIFFKKKSCSQ